MGSRLIFQSTRADVPCDQIFTMRLDGSDLQMVSSGAGRTTCGYFYPDGESMLYASTHLSDAECPPPPSFEMGYVWPIYDSYDIFRTNPDGTELTRLTDTPGYDAEATIGPTGTHRLYERSGWGHGDIFHEGRRFRRAATYESGRGQTAARSFRRMDRGLCSADGKSPMGAEYDDYKALLDGGLWRPTALEIFVMNADGGSVRQITDLGGASFAPFLAPGRPAHHIFIELAQSRRPELRPLHDQRRRVRPGARHVRRHVRRIPDVLS